MRNRDSLSRIEGSQGGRSRLASEHTTLPLAHHITMPTRTLCNKDCPEGAAQRPLRISSPRKDAIEAMNSPNQGQASAGCTVRSLTTRSAPQRRLENLSSRIHSSSTHSVSEELALNIGSDRHCPEHAAAATFAFRISLPSNRPMTIQKNFDNQQENAAATQASGSPHGIPLPEDLQHDSTSLPGTISPMALREGVMGKRRNDIRRQLGQIFIYPIVYTLVWLMPFVSHVMGGDGVHSSFGLTLSSLVSLCAQGMADSLVFSIQVKPWNHPKDKEGYGCRPLGHTRRRAGGLVARAGRTREEMLVDSTIAKRRREAELIERRFLRRTSEPQTREWWDGPLAHVDQEDPE